MNDELPFDYEDYPFAEQPRCAYCGAELDPEYCASGYSDDREVIDICDPCLRRHKVWTCTVCLKWYPVNELNFNGECPKCGGLE